MQNQDFRAIAQRSTRRGFESTCPFFFLLSKGELRPPATPRTTQALPPVDDDELSESTFTAKIGSVTAMKRPTATVLAIRKVQSTFPDMITVGRTANNDVVVTDVAVSRFHAFFELREDAVALADAGSRNGTTVNGEALKPRAPATVVPPGSLVAFGTAEFMLLDAGALWDRLHKIP